MECANAWHLGTVLDDLLLIVSELSANAVMHGRSNFTLSLSADPGRVLIEVADDNPRLPQMVGAEATALSGWGLKLVDCLSNEWGVRTPTPSGKVVWAELRTPPRRTGSQSSGADASSSPHLPSDRGDP